MANKNLNKAAIELKDKQVNDIAKQVKKNITSLKANAFTDIIENNVVVGKEYRYPQANGLFAGFQVRTVNGNPQVLMFEEFINNGKTWEIFFGLDNGKPSVNVFDETGTEHDYVPTMDVNIVNKKFLDGQLTPTIMYGTNGLVTTTTNTQYVTRAISDALLTMAGIVYVGNVNRKMPNVLTLPSTYRNHDTAFVKVVADTNLPGQNAQGLKDISTSGQAAGKVAGEEPETATGYDIWSYDPTHTGAPKVDGWVFIGHISSLVDWTPYAKTADIVNTLKGYEQIIKPAAGTQFADGALKIWNATLNAGAGGWEVKTRNEITPDIADYLNSTGAKTANIQIGNLYNGSVFLGTGHTKLLSIGSAGSGELHLGDSNSAHIKVGSSANGDITIGSTTHTDGDGLGKLIHAAKSATFEEIIDKVDEVYDDANEALIITAQGGW